jgi:acyl-CoA thioesterase FadM
VNKQPWRRDPAFYPFLLDLPTRYADVDAERHVNNVAVQSLHAEIRSQWHMALMGREGWLGLTGQVRPAAVATDFIAVTHYPAPVRCGLALLETTREGYTLASAMFQDGHCVSIQECRMAACDGVERVALPARLGESLAGYGLAKEAPPHAANVPATAAALPDMRSYPLSRMLTSRFGDMDGDGSISDASLARYVEQARSMVLTEAMPACGLDLRTGPLGMLVARVAMHGLRHAAPAPEVTLAAGVAAIGRTSVNLRVGVFNDGNCIALADNTMVFIARESGKPTPPPEALQQRLRTWMLQP